MVRRRVSEVSQAIPSWVASFDPAAWGPGSLNDRLLGWREAVRGWCRENDLAHSDPPLWADVVAGVHATRARLLFSSASGVASDEDLTAHNRDVFAGGGGA